MKKISVLLIILILCSVLAHSENLYFIDDFNQNIPAEKRGFFDWVNNNSGILSLIFSCVVAISAGIYAWLTWSLVSETKKMRKVQTEPEVCAYLQIKPGWGRSLQLVIHNIGLGTAFNVKYEIKFVYNQDIIKKLNEKKAKSLKSRNLKNEVNILPPNQKVFPYIIVYSIGKTEIYEYLDIEISYKNQKNEEVKKQFTPHLSEFIDVEGMRDDWPDELITKIYGVSETISGLKSELSDLNKTISESFKKHKS